MQVVGMKELVGMEEPALVGTEELAGMQVAVEKL